MIDVAPALDVPLSFEDGTDTLPGVVLGADTRIVLHEMFFALVGSGLVPIGFDPSFVDIDLNVGVGAQATPQLAAVLTTQLASIAVSGDGNETTHLGDFIPLNLQVLFALSRQLDAFAAVQFPSVEDAGDFYVLSAGANIRL